MIRILQNVRQFLDRESGHAMIEYLFMLSLVLLAALIGIGVVGATTLDLFTTSKNAMP